MSDIKEFIGAYIEEKIEQMDGREVYLCDLANTLYEGDNCDGVIWGGYEYCDNAREWVKEHEDELLATYGYWKFNCGEGAEILTDYFFYPCRAMCRVVFTYVDCAINHHYGNDKRWNQKIKITPYFIKKLKKSVKDGNILDNMVKEMDYYYNEVDKN